MSVYNFENPSRQSAKGIIVIFGVTAFKIIKSLVIVFVFLLFKYIQSGKYQNFMNTKFVLIVFGLVLLFLTVAVLKYLNFKFHVKEGYFFLKRGILNKEEISVSTSKIQNVYIKQNLLQQLINVVSLSIESAGDDNTEIEISALERHKAEALKSLLMQSAKAENDEIEDETGDLVYYKASVKKLLLEGVSENHFKSFVLIFAFIMGIYNDVKQFLDQLDLTEVFGPWFKLDDESLMGILLFNVSIVIVLLVLSFFLSLIRMFVKNFNLTVKRNADGLEISKGLFNKINLSLSSSRIQNTTVYTNKLKQVFGLYKLAFTQAMANKKQQLNFNIVGLGKHQISDLLQQFYPNVEERLIKNKPHKYLLHRVLFFSAIIVVLINVGLYFAPKSFLVINVPLLIYVVANAIYTYRKSYYHLDSDYIVVGGGRLVDTTTSFLEIKKVQAVTLKQTIFQKNKGLASIVVYSASKPLTIPHIHLTTAFTIKDYLLFKVESENKDWM